MNRYINYEEGEQRLKCHAENTESLWHKNINYRLPNFSTATSRLLFSRYGEALAQHLVINFSDYKIELSISTKQWVGIEHIQYVSTKSETQFCLSNLEERRNQQLNILMYFRHEIATCSESNMFKN